MGKHCVFLWLEAGNLNVLKGFRYCKDLESFFSTEDKFIAQSVTLFGVD
jgi:hypothetical protein